MCRNKVIKSEEKGKITPQVIFNSNALNWTLNELVKRPSDNSLPLMPAIQWYWSQDCSYMRGWLPGTAGPRLTCQTANVTLRDHHPIAVVPLLLDVVQVNCGQEYSKTLTNPILICDVIWENPAYGGTKRTGSDQTPHILCSIWSKPRLFVTYEHLQKTLLLLSTQFIKQSMNIKWKRLIKENTVCSSISRVFPDAVIYIMMSYRYI